MSNGASEREAGMICEGRAYGFGTDEYCEQTARGAWVSRETGYIDLCRECEQEADRDGLVRADEWEGSHLFR